MNLEKEKINKDIIEMFNLSIDDEHKKVSSVDEVLDILSDYFITNYKYTNDYQDALDLTKEEYKHLTNKYSFIYSLTGDKSFKITLGDNFNENDLDKYISIARIAYPTRKIETIQDLLSSLNNDLEDTKCNVGCDVFTAYNLIMDDHFYELDDNVFVIDNSEPCDPRITILY